MIPISYNVRSLATRKWTTFFTALGIGLVVAVLAVALMLSEGIKRTLVKGGRDDNAVIMRMGSDAELSSGIQLAQLQNVLARPQVARVSNEPMAVGEIVVVLTVDKVGGSGVGNLQVRGVPQNVMQFRPEVKIVEGRAPKPGTDEVMIGRAIRGRFVGVDLNRVVELKKNRPMNIVGVFTAGGASYESEVWADVDTLRQAFGREGVVSSMRVRLTSTQAFDDFRREVERDKALGLQVMREPVFFEKMGEGTAFFLGFMGTVISVFCALGAMIGAMITMYSAVANRAREIGILRALGFSRGAILLSFVLESVVLAIIGGVIGVGLSMFATFVELSMTNFATWSELVFRLPATPGIIISSLITATVVGLLGGLLPAIRATRVSPLEAMRA
jgi:putative ABC transport system permease protein